MVKSHLVNFERKKCNDKVFHSKNLNRVAEKVKIGVGLITFTIKIMHFLGDSEKMRQNDFFKMI